MGTGKEEKDLCKAKCEKLCFQSIAIHSFIYWFIIHYLSYARHVSRFWSNSHKQEKIKNTCPHGAYTLVKGQTISKQLKYVSCQLVRNLINREK